jgi:hypothetical protein
MTTRIRRITYAAFIRISTRFLATSFRLRSEFFARSGGRCRGRYDTLRAESHTEGTAHALANLANVAILTSDYASAGPLVQESLQLYRELGSAYDMALSVERAAGIAAGTDHPERALRLAGASAAHLTALGVSRPRIFQERSERMIEQARRALNEAAQNALWGEGHVLSLEQAVAYALEQPAAAV